MPEINSWDDVAIEEKNSPKSSKKGNTIRNLKMESNHTYVVRFVGAPVMFYKYWVGGKTAICGNPAECPVRQNRGIEPQKKYASNVILREVLDSDQDPIKTDYELGIIYKWEFPPAVTKSVISWKKLRNQEPGGDNGCDWAVTVTGVEKMTRYNLTNLDITPLTADEKKMIENESYDLSKLYKAVPPDEIEDRLFGNKTPNKRDEDSSSQNPSPKGKAGFSDESVPF